jgi:WD40 repeat protein
MSVVEAAKCEQVTPLGGGAKQIRAKYTTNPGDATECFCVRFSPDDAYLAASYSNGCIRVFNADTGKQEFVLNSPEKKEEASGGYGGAHVFAPLPVTQLRWRPHSAQSKTKSVLISVNAEFDGQILHWHIKSGKCLHTITEKGNSLFCLDYFHDGSQFATAGRDRIVRIYDEATKRPVQTLQGGDLKNTAGHSNRVFSLKYHPQHPHIILSGGWDNTVQMWDTRKGNSVKSLWNCYLCGDSVDFNSAGDKILTGSWRINDALQLWDFGTGEVIESINWKTAGTQTSCMLFSAQFSKDAASSMIMAGGSQENEAKFFSVPNSGATPSPFGALMNLPKPVFSTDFSPNSKLAAVGCADGLVRVLELK